MFESLEARTLRAVLPAIVAGLDQAGTPISFALSTPAQPVLMTDTGTLSNDNITSANNSDLSNAPVFNVVGVEPDATVVLYRNSLEVARLARTAGGTIAIADLNGGTLPGQKPISDGIYAYRIQLIDQAGTPGPLSSPLTVTIDHSAPLAPSPPILQPASDTSNGFAYTTKNNSLSPLDAPVFDVTGVASDAGVVVLYRAPVVQGVVGPFVQVNALSVTTGGKVAIADLNDGDGQIPDGTYVYQARQTDLAGNVGLLSANSGMIRIDTMAPGTLAPPRLNPASDTGISNTDGITQITLGAFPFFDIDGAEGGAMVRLFRLAAGATSAVLVGWMVAPASQTPIDIKITDTISPIPDGLYTYRAQQTDRAGNVSEISLGCQVIYDTSRPPTPGALALDAASQPIGSNPPTTSVRNPSFNVDVTIPDSKANSSLTLVRDGQIVFQGPFNVTSGRVTISDPGPVSDGIHTYQVFLTDPSGNKSALSDGVQIRFAPAAPGAPTLDPSSDSWAKGDNVTSVHTPFFNVSGVPAGATLKLMRDGVVVNTLTAASGGTVTIGDPGPLLNRSYRYTAVLIDGAGNVGPAGAPLVVSVVSVQGDYDGDGRADLALFRRVSASQANWFVAGGIEPPGTPSFGSGTLDVPMQGDVDGDGRTDLVLYRPGSSQWFVYQSSRGYAEIRFGGPGDLPVLGDFAGVGYSQLAVYRPGTGEWFVAGQGGVFTQFGGPADIPIALRNYYGNGRDILAVYRPGTGEWFVAGQGAGIGFGGPGDLPMPLYNYYGDGRAVLGVFRPGTCEWFVGGQPSGVSFGGPGDIAVALDFDGIGREQPAVYRPGTGEWFVGGHAAAVAQFGGSGDIPLSSPYAYRSLGGVVVAGETSAGGPVETGGTSSIPVEQGITPPPAPPPRPRVKQRAQQIVKSGPRPNQDPGSVHDSALAALQGLPGRRRGRGWFGAL